MSESDDDLLAGLSRSADPVDRRLADLLGELVPPPGRRVVGPRASETLAAFLAAHDPVAAAPLDIVREPAEAPDIVVELGRTRPRRPAMRSYLVPLRTLLRTSLLAKVVLGATVALTGVGAVAATTGPDTSNDVVTVVPASDSGDAGDDTTGVLEVDDDHEGLAHEGDIDDGPDPDDVDEPDDDADDQGDVDEPDDDADDQGEDADDQGEDADDQGEDADDQGEDADDQGDDADDQGDDDATQDADDDADDDENESDDGADSEDDSDSDD